MINPGALNQRLTLEIPVEAADGAGGLTRGYEAGPRVWASLKPVAARGDVVAAGLGVTVTHRIVVRAGPEVTVRHRFAKGARRFRILAVREDDNAGRFLVIDAEERRD